MSETDHRQAECRETTFPVSIVFAESVERTSGSAVQDDDEDDDLDEDEDEDEDRDYGRKPDGGEDEDEEQDDDCYPPGWSD